MLERKYCLFSLLRYPYEAEGSRILEFCLYSEEPLHGDLDIKTQLSKINKWTLSKLKNFCKKQSTKWKQNPWNERKYFQMIQQTRGWYSKYINNSYNSTVKTNSIKKWADLNRHFSKDDIQMAKKHMQRCWMSLTIRQMQIKSTIR